MGNGKLDFQEKERELSDWMQRAQRGDTAAYRCLLEATQKLLEVYLRRSLRRLGIFDRALQEDILQDTLLAIHEKRRTYDSSFPLTAWMHAIARYKMIDALRKRRFNVENLDSAELEKIEVAPHQDAWIENRDLHNLLEGLSPRQQELLELAKLQNLPLSEVARRTGLSLSLVKVTIHRTLKLLRQRDNERETSL